MSKLSVYYDKECTKIVMSHDIDIINLYASDIFKNKYWKYNVDIVKHVETKDEEEVKDREVIDNKLNEFEMIEYGEYILSIIEKYVKTDFNINFLHLFKFVFLTKPTNFNLELTSLYIYQKQYKSLETYINNYIQFNTRSTEIQSTEIRSTELIYKPFFDFLSEFSSELKKYFEDDIYYNSEINHYICKKYLDEIKSFGYFNLKFGESGYTGMYIIDLN